MCVASRLYAADRAARTRHLFLFLHARALLSCAVRLNVVGPYVGQRLLLHDVRPMIAAALVDAELKTTRVPAEDDASHGPATVSPLLEIIAARHDVLASRIFNS